MIRIAFAVAAMTFGISAAVAQLDTLSRTKTRIVGAMKEMEDSIKLLVPIANGEGNRLLPWSSGKDRAVALGELSKLGITAIRMYRNAYRAPAAGSDTALDQKIQQNMNDFNAKWAKLIADAEIKDVNDFAGFKATFSRVSKDCSDCHEFYGVKAN